jgi:hypothetical protein
MKDSGVPSLYVKSFHREFLVVARSQLLPLWRTDGVSSFQTGWVTSLVSIDLSCACVLTLSLPDLTD